MIPIIDFCWRTFQLVEIPNATVSDLAVKCEEFGDQLFVFCDPNRQAAALVVPNQVQELAAEMAAVASHMSVTSILEPLTRNQLVVHRGEAATQVIARALEREAHFVLAVGDQGKPVGLLSPMALAERLSGEQPPAGLKVFLANIPRTHVGDMVRAIEDQFDGIFSDGLNQMALDALVCSHPGSLGTVERCPCCEHGDAHCGPRSIASL